ncbi:cytosolic sulfotransferase 13-like [Contarinia nasturtii]|uniref:cytosolic sulfotransferase 13-like n=1 Tax=Contarinia nasturtii TaxID=265458 RepID=UPI0012D3B639|nr:cytosolic sulfotransferase 13-like [Contarinia nasturtii]
MLYSTSNLDKENSNPYIFEEVKTPVGKKSLNNDNKNTFLLANTKPWANKHLPFPKDYKFEPLRSDDVWILGHPKSGSTWTENIVWQLKNGFDFSEEPLALKTSPILERETKPLVDNIEAGNKDVEFLNNALSPRVILSHLPPNLLPIELWTIRPKIIYSARTMEEYFDIFLDNRTIYAPFHVHILANWQLRNLDHFLFLNYEEQLTDQFGAVQRNAKFLECTYGEDELKQLMEYSSIENMRKLYNKPLNGFQFFRNGKAGEFADVMSEEYIKKFDEWTAAHLKGSDFKFAI